MTGIDFAGRVAIVTGAGAGLGKDYAIELAKRNAKVVVNDLGGARDGVGSDSAIANKVVEEIKAFGGEAVPNYDNVATIEGGENIVKTAVDAFGKVDILVNNAGILRDRTFAKMSAEDWDAVVSVHMRGTYCVTKPAFLNMRDNGYGRIIATASTSGTLGNFGQTNYGAAKLGIAGMVNTLKLEGAKYNIKANVLLPSAATRLTEDVMPPEAFKQMKVGWVTPAVIYLCSEQCRDTGFYIMAVAGRICRSAIVTAPGVTFKEIPTPEAVMEKWETISSLDGAKFYPGTIE
ncbi:MAG: SDR family oxidoreductase, partial [Deltaproteobacteria bacterium]|nr:SDR family oxidoreductase [Deltaproteobacteria bacterium]